MSDLDKEISIKKILVIPLSDNVSAIYSGPLSKHLESLVETQKQWNLITDENIKPQQIRPEDFEESPAKVLDMFKKKNVDALLTGRISKGPNGLNIRLILFSGKGLPFVNDQIYLANGFDIADVKSQLEVLFKRLISRIPYKGQILSRRDRAVTMNIGSNDGLREGQEITAVQIIKLTRHPKFQFVTAVDRVIMGRIQLTKVEPTLSFGVVISERDENAVVVGTKLLSSDFKDYPPPAIGGEGQALPELGNRKDQEVAFGNSPREWVPDSPPTFGKLGILLGVGSYQVSNSLSVGGVSDTNSFVPSVHLLGEMWLSPEWILEAQLRQYVFKLNNNYPSGSLPSKLNVSSQQVTFLAGYNFLIGEEFFGPKLQLLGGYSRFNSYIDQSNPAAFNSLTYSGVAIGVSGSFPIKYEEKDTPFSLGGRLLYYLTTSLDESPSTSGASNSSKITQFSAFGDYRYSERIVFHGELNFDLFSSSFTGAGTRAQPASSASHTLTTLAAGIAYLF